MQHRSVAAVEHRIAVRGVWCLLRATYNGLERLLDFFLGASLLCILLFLAFRRHGGSAAEGSLKRVYVLGSFAAVVVVVVVLLLLLLSSWTSVESAGCQMDVCFRESGM